jgi:hypothetical protein
MYVVPYLGHSRAAHLTTLLPVQFYVPQIQWNWNTFFGAAFLLLWYIPLHHLLAGPRALACKSNTRVVCSGTEARMR